MHKLFVRFLLSHSAVFVSFDAYHFRLISSWLLCFFVCVFMLCLCCAQFTWLLLCQRSNWPAISWEYEFSAGFIFGFCSNFTFHHFTFHRRPMLFFWVPLIHSCMSDTYIVAPESSLFVSPNHVHTYSLGIVRNCH